MKYTLEIPPVAGGPIRRDGIKIQTLGTCTRVYVPKIGSDGYLLTGFGVDEEGVKERKEFETKLRMSDGGLKSESDYWKTFKIQVGNQGLILDTSNALDALRVKVLKADPDVATSMEEWKKYPSKYLFIITSKEEKAVKTNKARNEKAKAYALFSAMTPNDKRGALIRYGTSTKTADTMDLDVLEDELGTLMERNFSIFIRTCSDDLLKTKVLIERYVAAGIIERTSSDPKLDNQELKYNGNSLGHNLTAVAEFMLDKKNAEVIQTIKKVFKGKA